MRYFSSPALAAEKASKVPDPVRISGYSKDEVSGGYLYPLDSGQDYEVSRR